MAQITKRYFFNGPPLECLKLTTDPGLILAAIPFVLAFDLRFDDSVVSTFEMDEQMQVLGYKADPLGTILGGSLVPFFGLISPDGSAWQLEISNLGILTTKKVS